MAMALCGSATPALPPYRFETWFPPYSLASDFASVYHHFPADEPENHNAGGAVKLFGALGRVFGED